MESCVQFTMLIREGFWDGLIVTTICTLIFSYMRGRLTLEKINTAVDEMATFAEANARLLAASRKKVNS